MERVSCRGDTRCLSFEGSWAGANPFNVRDQTVSSLPVCSSLISSPSK